MANKTILVVEDDEDQLLAMRLRLTANGYGVAMATNGADAVEVARRECPDLILLDLGLPGADGYDVLGDLRGIKTAPFTPIVVISARDRRTHGARTLDAGAKAFLEKPMEEGEPLRTIRGLLGE